MSATGVTSPLQAPIPIHVAAGPTDPAPPLVTPLPISAIAPVSLEPLSAVDPSAPVDPRVGTIFGGKYLIEKVLGVGGMGIVYAARHQAIGKRFAVKLLHVEQTKDPEVVERFRVEAQSASAIGSEHIIGITDFDTLPDGATYFVMEYLDGKPLSKLFEEIKSVPTERLARIAKQIAQGLGAAHAAGITHRDLKPDNIFLVKRSGGETDFVKILDFGIAKVGQGAGKLTKAGAIFGTPHYMSPEQASGAPVDTRTDIYALGVILYEGAVGRVPFDAENYMGILTQHMYKAPVPPRAVPECPPNLPPGLEVIIMRCLRKKPEERYQTMEELELDLERLLRGEVPKAASDMMALSGGFQSIAQSAMAAAAMPTPIPGEPSMGTPQRSRLPIVVGVAALVAVGAIGAFSMLGGGSKTHAGAAPSEVATTKPPPKEEPSKVVAPAPSTRAEAEKKPRTIMIDAAGAPGAKVYDGDKLVAEAPTNIELESGSSRALTVKAPGFVDKTITIDDASPTKVEVALARVAVVAPTGPATTKPKGKKSTSDVDDPWAH